MKENHQFSNIAGMVKVHILTICLKKFQIFANFQRNNIAYLLKPALENSVFQQTTAKIK